MGLDIISDGRIDEILQNLQLPVQKSLVHSNITSNDIIYHIDFGLSPRLIIVDASLVSL